MHFSNNCMHAPYIVATVQHQIEAKKPQMIRYIWPKICWKTSAKGVFDLETPKYI